MKAHHMLAVCMVVFSLTGCDGVRRNCDGFHHPLAEVWTGNDGLGEVRSFVDDAGNIKSYTLQSIDKTGPRVSGPTAGSDPNRVMCWETAEYLYVQTDADIAYELEFLQRDGRADLATEDHIVQLAVNTQNPVGTDIDPIIGVNLWWWISDQDLDTTVNTMPEPPEGTTWPSVTEYFPEATINGSTYVDLLQMTFNDNSDRFTSGLVDEEAKWVRFLVARDFGLVQYELLNGTVYTLARE